MQELDEFRTKADQPSPGDAQVAQAKDPMLSPLDGGIIQTKDLQRLVKHCEIELSVTKMSRTFSKLTCIDQYLTHSGLTQPDSARECSRFADN